MKKFVLTLVVLSIAGLCFAGSPEFTKSYEGKMGDVSFNHTTHSQVIECQECHLVEGVAIEMDKKVAHKLCKDCHRVVENAPTKCKGCHTK